MLKISKIGLLIKIDLKFHGILPKLSKSVYKIKYYGLKIWAKCPLQEDCCDRVQ